MINFERLIVGVDGSDGSKRALAWATSQIPDGHLTVVHAFSPGVELLAAAAQVNLDPVRADHKKSLATTWSESPRAAGVEFEVELIDDEVSAALVDAADRRSADAIVVGHQGHGRWSQHHIGRVASRLLHHCPVPLVITSDTTEPAPVSGPILVGLSHPSIDDNPELDWAIEFATQHKLGLHLVSLVEPMMYFDEAYVVDMNVVASALTEQLSALVAELQIRLPDVDITAASTMGYPVTELARAATEIDAGLVVLGSHHPPALVGFLAGSVAQLLPPHLECPMVAVPRA